MNSEEEVPEIAVVRAGEEFDVEAVEAFARASIPDLEGNLEVLQFPGGHANLTYLLRFADRELVLRRPPFGPVGPGAHDMVREYKVLSRLWEYFDRAPRAFALCEDHALIGATFFLMERRTGVVVRNSVPEEMAHHPDVERRISLALVEAMADFHAVDYQKAGLADLGKPDGFVDRQLSGWYKRWGLAKDRELPEFEELYQWLLTNQPASPAPTLLHNDFKLDNSQFDPGNPDRVQSIFDWDMATIGDPLMDLGTLLAYWTDAQEGSEDAVVTLMAKPGFPKPQALAEHYSELRGVPTGTIAWYTAFGLWKTAVVVQQIYIRFKRGQTDDERFAGFGARAPVLCALGLDSAREFGT